MSSIENAVQEKNIPQGGLDFDTSRWMFDPILIGAVVVGFAPYLVLHFSNLWSREQYQYFPFVIAAVTYLFWTRFREAPSTTPTHVAASRTAKICYWASAVLLFAALWIRSPWLGAISLNILLFGVVLQIRPTGRVSNIMGIWLLLWLMIPPPVGMDNLIVMKLQRLSSVVGSGILDLLSINHLLAGDIIEVPDKKFFVDQACSGIVSVMSVIACAMIYCVWCNRTLLHSVVLVFVSVCWAVAMNVGRICAIAFAYDRWNVDLSTGLQHDILGLLGFCLTFVALVSTDKLLVFLLGRIGNVDTENIFKNPLIRVWNRVVTSFDPNRQEEDATNQQQSMHSGANGRTATIWAFAAALALPGTLQFIEMMGDGKYSVPFVERTLQIDESFLEDDTAGWSRKELITEERDARSRIGRYSKTFVFERSDDQAISNISFDFPFAGWWHELPMCYEVTGWQITGRRLLNEEFEEDSNGQIVEVGFRRTEDGRRGYLLFCMLTPTGELVDPPSQNWWARFMHKLNPAVGRSIWPQLLQSQVWTEYQASVDEEDKVAVRQLFSKATQQFQEFLAEG